MKVIITGKGVGPGGKFAGFLLRMHRSVNKIATKAKNINGIVVLKEHTVLYLCDIYS